VQVAEPPIAAHLDDLAADAPADEALPASAAAHRAPAPPTCSESMTRRAGCGKSACPDPWGAGDWNLPGLPDPYTVVVKTGPPTLVDLPDFTPSF
jgi:hypothetical protein